MNAVLALAKKELRGYFLSPVAYAVLTAFLLLNGFLFSLILRALSQPGAAAPSPLSLFFGGTIFFWIFLIVTVPVITMRLGSEEFKSGTLETLLTAPVSDLEVVLGKFFGAVGLFAALWLPTLLYGWALSRYARVDWGPVATGYLGVLAAGLFFVAAGLFTSFLSKNQMVAAVLAFALLLLLLLLSLVSYLVTDPLWKEVFAYLDLYAAMQNFAKGLVDSRALTYCLSGAAFFLALAQKALETRRWR